jgi:UTP--glucose-1-phosphate uridylyltransferase
MNNKPVRKAVIAAAGFGTRFLPQTKAMPKEMLPIVDKPIIQYIVEELVDAGIEDIVIVTGYHKRSIEDHFDAISGDLAANLQQGNKLEMLEQIKGVPNLANFAYVRQKGIYGNATPIKNAAHLVGDEPFIYAYADDLYLPGDANTPTRFKQMIQMYEEFGSSILPCVRIESDEEFKRYGIVGGEEVREGVIKMNTIEEKPGRENAPSNLANNAGYLFTPEIFEYLERFESQVPEGQEFQVQGTMRAMMQDGKKFYAFELANNKYYDTGNKLEYLKTTIDFALRRKDIGPALTTYIKSLTFDNHNDVV